MIRYDEKRKIVFSGNFREVKPSANRVKKSSEFSFVPNGGVTATGWIVFPEQPKNSPFDF